MWKISLCKFCRLQDFPVKTLSSTANFAKISRTKLWWILRWIFTYFVTFTILMMVIGDNNLLPILRHSGHLFCNVSAWISTEFIKYQHSTIKNCFIWVLWRFFFYWSFPTQELSDHPKTLNIKHNRIYRALKSRLLRFLCL